MSEKLGDREHDLRDILAKNGSAVDAAVAALFCNGVVNMQSMGLGGGFIMTLYERATRTGHSLVARETAPGSATKNMFDRNSTLSRDGFCPSFQLSYPKLILPRTFTGSFPLIHYQSNILNNISIKFHYDKSLKTLACLFKAQITRCLPAAQRFALLALLEKKLTRACKLQAQIKRRAFITKKKDKSYRFRILYSDWSIRRNFLTAHEVAKLVIRRLKVTNQSLRISRFSIDNELTALIGRSLFEMNLQSSCDRSDQYYLQQ
ncbi:hypothetical protein J6590_054930 [Homalodisca vitripennis]|nr:hypothetical protein J6590_054930 [Homalodisca vitripennis]